MEISSVSASEPTVFEPVLDKDSRSMEEIVAGIAEKAFANLENNPPAEPIQASRVSKNPGVEAVNVVLEFQQHAVVVLQNTEAATKKILTTIDKLLDLSYEINALSKEDKAEFNDKAKAILAALKEQGIDLVNDDGVTMTKEQFLELKSLIGSHVDQSRTKVQQLFTKIQTIIQDIASVNDSGKKLLNDFTQMIRTILHNMRPS